MLKGHYIKKKIFSTPSRIVSLSFLCLISLGAVLLKLFGCREGCEMGFADAIFTSASASCVTGLTVLDTGKNLSLAGQLTVLSLIQLGGLGITTFSTIFILLIRRGLAFRERDLLRTTVMPLAREDILRIFKEIVFLTVFCELVGALLLWLKWQSQFDRVDALYLAIFHSISAYCNAGFSLFSNSLVSFRGDYLTNIVMITLIFMGGIGFWVVIDCKRSFMNREKLSLHSKLALSVTILLISLGTLGFYLLEDSFSLQGMPLGEQLITSLFQAVTPRTAGFFTIEMTDLKHSTILLVMLLMFIGASPGSTGGGIKTTTFGVMLLLARARFTGHSHILVWRRTIPEDIVNRSIMIFLISILIITVFTFILLVLQPDGDFLSILFESLSAYGTVGLSTGITGGLSSASKILVSLLMFIGRVGPLTIAIAVGEQYRRLEYSYAEENVIVG